MEPHKSVAEDPTTHILWTFEIDPLYGELERPATRLETIAYKAKQFVHGFINSNEA
ncbi:hypothetical protein BH10PAT3_BH10PAT3_8110 [soil metagenome]